MLFEYFKIMASSPGWYLVVFLHVFISGRSLSQSAKAVNAGHSKQEHWNRVRAETIKKKVSAAHFQFLENRLHCQEGQD